MKNIYLFRYYLFIKPLFTIREVKNVKNVSVMCAALISVALISFLKWKRWYRKDDTDLDRDYKCFTLSTVCFSVLDGELFCLFPLMGALKSKPAGCTDTTAMTFRKEKFALQRGSVRGRHIEVTLESPAIKYWIYLSLNSTDTLCLTHHD